MGECELSGRQAEGNLTGWSCSLRTRQGNRRQGREETRKGGDEQMLRVQTGSWFSTRLVFHVKDVSKPSAGHTPAAPPAPTCLQEDLKDLRCT